MPAFRFGYKQLRLTLIAAYVLFAAGMLGATALYLWSDRQSRVREAYAATGTLARALEEHVSRTFGTIEVHLRNVGRRLVETGALARPSTPRVVAMLRERAAQAGIVLSLYAYDASGIGHSGSRGFDITPLNATDYEHTRQILEGGTDRLVIARVRAGVVTGQPSIPVALGAFDKSGHLAGIVGSSVDPEYFFTFYKSLTLGEGGSVALLRRDGAVLARFPKLPSAADDLSRSTAFREQIATQPSGTTEITASLDQTRRIISFRHIPEYDLIVGVTERSDAVLAPWRRLAATVGLAVVAILSLFLALLIFSLRELRAHAGAEEALRKNFELLDRIFETTHFCLVYLDRDLNFVRVNRAYADACGYPTEYFPGKNHFALYPNAEDEALFRRAVATGEPFTVYARPFEFPDHPERDVTYWDWSLLPLKNNEGRGEGLLFALLEVTASKQAETALRGYAHRIRDLLRRLVGAQETERRWVAADLHDLIAQNIGAIGIEIERLRRRLPAEKDGGNDRVLDVMANQVADTAGAVRQLIANLRPSILDDHGLLAAIEWQARDFEQRTCLRVTIMGQPVEPRAAPDAELALFRIVQEALANIARHAAASHVTIELSRAEGRLRLRVEDDGIGLASRAGAPHADGWGIDIMRERAEAVGGEFGIDSPGAGTRVIVEIPLADSDHTG